MSFVREVFSVMADTPRHTYQLVTKRSHRLVRLADRLGWPPNIWLGVSASATIQPKASQNGPARGKPSEKRRQPGTATGPPAG